MVQRVPKRLINEILKPEERHPMGVILGRYTTPPSQSGLFEVCKQNGEPIAPPFESLHKAKKFAYTYFKAVRIDRRPAPVKIDLESELDYDQLVANSKARQIVYQDQINAMTSEEKAELATERPDLVIEQTESKED